MDSKTRAERLRLALFLTVLAWIVVVPALRQGFGVKRWWTHDWSMFAGSGSYRVLDARFFDARPGHLREIDRRALIPPADYRNRLFNDREVLESARLLCREAGAAADIRVVTRESGPGGWRSGRDGAVNLCLAGNAK